MHNETVLKCSQLTASQVKVTSDLVVNVKFSASKVVFFTPYFFPLEVCLMHFSLWVHHINLQNSLIRNYFHATKRLDLTLGQPVLKHILIYASHRL